MAVRGGRLLRPLLGVRRSQTRACCAAIGLQWREDPTNAGDGPLRNRVRQRLLPLLEELRPGATQALARTATLAADERDWLAPLVATATEGLEQAGVERGGVDRETSPNPPWVTLPEGAPSTRGEGDARPPRDDGDALPPGGEGAEPPRPGGVALDAAGLAGLPVALGRRVVREAARRAGVAVPDAAATDRVLDLAGTGDGAATTWPGGAATRAGTVVRLGLPAD
jgi:tRNA(Ile)-lysidine synthase